MRHQRRHRAVIFCNIAERQRIVTLAEKSAELSRSNNQRDFSRSIQMNGRLWKCGVRSNSMQHGTVARHVFGRWQRISGATSVIAARHRKIECRPVVEIFMRHAAHDTQSISDARDLRHMFTESHACDGCLDRLEGSSNFFRSIRFRIPHIDLALATAGEYHDDGLRFSKARRGSFCFATHGSLRDQTRQSPVQPAKTTNAQPFPAGHSRILVLV